jgi:Condensation domain
METPQSRRLGSFERAEVLTGEHFAFNVVTALRLAGRLSGRAVRRALDEVQSRHPLLRVRIEGAGRQRRFALGGVEPIPLREIEQRESEVWVQVAEHELNTRFDIAAGPLMRAVFIGGGDACELVLTFHHAIVDAASVLHVVQEVLSLCAGAALPAPPEQRLPACADQVFPSAYRGARRWPASGRYLARQIADEAVYSWRTRGERHVSADGPWRCQVLSLVLEESETTALVRATRRRRVGVFSALSAAMLLAVVNRLYGNRAGVQRYFAFPLLRPYLAPPVAADIVAGYLTTLRLTMEVDPAQGLWPTAQRMHHQVDVAAKRGERFLASRWSAASMRILLARRERMAATALNYAGAVRLEVSAGAPFTVEGFHAFATDFLPGPEYTGQARIFGGRLWLDLVYLDVDMDRAGARAIAHEMRDLVLGSVEHSGMESA